MKFVTTTPIELDARLHDLPAAADFLDMGQALIGPQPSLMDLIDRCAKSMQEQAKQSKSE